jgi:hypothetical protein
MKTGVHGTESGSCPKTGFCTSGGEAYCSLITAAETLFKPWSPLTATIMLLKLRVIPIVMCGCAEITCELSLEHATVFQGWECRNLFSQSTSTLNEKMAVLYLIVWTQSQTDWLDPQFRQSTLFGWLTLLYAPPALTLKLLFLHTVYFYVFRMILTIAATTALFLYLSIYLSVHPSIHPSIHPPIYLSIYLSIYNLCGPWPLF